MKFSVDKNGITGILSMVQAITNRKTNLPITSDVLIKTEGEHVSITANNFETIFSGKYDTDVESEGKISVNAKKLYEIIKGYPDTWVPIKSVSIGDAGCNCLEIGDGSIKYRIIESDCELFPETPDIKDTKFYEIDSAKLKRMIKTSTIIGSSKDEKRPYILGAMLENISQGIRMVSTDAKALGCFDFVEADCELQDDEMTTSKKIIIPKKGLAEISGFLEHDGGVFVGIKNNHFITMKDNETIMVKLLDGDFPDYKKVINIEGMNSIVVDRITLLDAMKRMWIMSSNDYKIVMFNFSKNKIKLRINNPKIGDSREEIDIEYDGPDIEVAFNPRYFISALAAMDGQVVNARIKSNKAPCILENITGDDFKFSIMPMST